MASNYQPTGPGARNAWLAGPSAGGVFFPPHAGQVLMGKAGPYMARPGQKPPGTPLDEEERRRRRRKSLVGESMSGLALDNTLNALARGG